MRFTTAKFNKEIKESKITSFDTMDHVSLKIRLSKFFLIFIKDKRYKFLI